MLKLFFLVIKVTLFSIAVLILGNYVEWGGKSLSDQVRSHMSQATRIGEATLEDSKRAAESVSQKVGKWSDGLLNDAKDGATRMGLKDKIQEAAQTAKNHVRKVAKKVSNDGSNEEVTSSERAKLRALIKELNRSWSDATQSAEASK